jgi:hypothetical protein
MRLILLVIVAVALVGCAMPMATHSAPPGSYPLLPSDTHLQIHQWMRANLFDPDSAKDEAFQDPQKWWYYSGLLFGNRDVFGWMVAVDFNAKNRYGGYTGLQRSYFLFMEGRMINCSAGDLAGGFSGPVAQ